jgi:hypothetical protein
MWGIEKMRPYLEGYRFTVLTDHQSLKWLQAIKNPTGRLLRWAIFLQQHDFDIRYRKGVLNRVADALSRQPAAAKDACQRYKTPQQQPPGKMHPTPNQQPWETVSTDLVGPWLQPR